MRKDLLLLVACWFGSGCFGSSLRAQNSGLAGPQSGFVFDRASGTIRPVIGVPGSAHLGSAAVKQVRYGAVSPDGSAAIILENRQLSFATSLSSTEPALVPLGGASTPPDALAWAPDSSAAAWHFHDSPLIQRFTVSHGQPVPSGAIDLAALGYRISALAIAPFGGRIYAAVRDGSSSGVYLISPGSHPLQIALIGDPVALAFDQSGENLYALDGRTGAVFEIRGASGTSAASPFIAPSGTVTDFVGLAVGRYNTRLYTVSRSARLVREYEIGTGNLLAELPLDSPPSSMQPLGGNSVFLLNAARGPLEPLLVLNANADAAVYMIPSGGPGK